MKLTAMVYARCLVALALLSLPACAAQAAEAPSLESELDRQVWQHLVSQRGSWRDMNVPEVDGALLYELILANGYTRALEIGTSTGHSTIWIAWALSKTGGKLVTVEIDEHRHKRSLDPTLVFLSRLMARSRERRDAAGMAQQPRWFGLAYWEWGTGVLRFSA